MTSFRSSEGHLLLLLPAEAEGRQLVHVAAVDLRQGVGPQGAALCQLLVPTEGAPGLQLLLDALQDLLVMRRGDLSSITPVQLWRAIGRQAEDERSSLTAQQ